jgi:hypothetical protein
MRFTSIVMAATALALTAAGVATGATRVSSPDDEFTLALTGQVKPARLAASEPTPTSFHLGGRVTSQKPAAEFPDMRRLVLEADRSVRLDVEGLPVCRVLGLPVTPPPWNHCKDGIVGHGEVTILYSIPESAPIQISSETVVYNGGVKGGLTNLWIRAYFPLPKPNTSLARMKVKRIHRGRYGLEASLAVPELADRFGSLLSFDLTLDKSIVSASCPDGHLSVRGSTSFETDSGEVELPFASTKRCTASANHPAG